MLFKAAKCLSHYPHFDALFTVASCGPNSPIGGILFVLVVSSGRDAPKFVDNLIHNHWTDAESYAETNYGYVARNTLKEWD